MASPYFVYDSTECRMNDLRVLWLYVIPVFDPGGKLLHPPFPTLSQSNAQLNRSRPGLLNCISPRLRTVTCTMKSN